MVSLTELTKTVYASNGNNPEPIEILFNLGAEHVSLQTDLWTVSAWKENEVQLKGTQIIDQIEKIQSELLNDIINGKNTTLACNVLDPVEAQCTPDSLILNGTADT